MKVKFLQKKMIFIILALSLLAGCGGGGSSSGGGPSGSCGTGADCATYSFDGVSSVLTEKAYDQSYNDPEIYAELFTNMSNTRTHIVAKNNIAPNYPQYDRKLEITTPGTLAGTFPDVAIVYSSLTGSSYTSVSSTVNITQYDSSVGGHIAGTFDAMMCDWVDIHYPGPTCTGATKQMTGTFYVTKYNF